jgi:hypothetical protein
LYQSKREDYKMAKKKIKKIPYGTADFERIQTKNMYYIDKTHYIPLIEESPDHIFLIRPRRFGKSLWMSVLETYYDINKKEKFNEFFKGTYIGQNPTEERNSYLILYFNFAAVNPDIKKVARSFESNCKTEINDFINRYERFIDKQTKETVISSENLDTKLQTLFRYFKSNETIKTYLLIDEYDNFTNTIIATAGTKEYHNLTQGEGVVRFFFNMIKSGTTGSNSAISRSFITGVSPVTMDDVTSGHNIGNNLSLNEEFNELYGFTQDDVKNILKYYYSKKFLKLDPDVCLKIMTLWYNNYKFSKNANKVLYNTDMVLYFLLEAKNRKIIPDDMIDSNVRIDYRKLKHLMIVDQKFNGNFSLLKTIVENQEIVSDIAKSFPIEELTLQENFISLLFYFGLLTINKTKRGKPLLKITNLTVQKLMFGYLRDAYLDQNIFRIDPYELSNLIGDMAYDGEWKPFFKFLTNEIEKQTAIRDFLDGEKVVQTFVMAYLNISDYFITESEKEAGKGYADLFLQPFLAAFPDMEYSYLIELKYLSKSEFTEKKLENKIKDAKNQLAKYSDDDKLKKIVGSTKLKRLVVVYKAWELIHLEEVL